jgi:hypothetical protein
VDLLEEDLFVDDRLAEDFLDPFFDDEAFELFFFGTFAPSLRASESPMAIACLRLFTFFPEPLRKVPCLRSCIVFSTLSWAFFEYFAMINY